MSELEQLQIPLTEIETGELMSAARNGCGDAVLTPAGMMLLRRLAFERGALRSERDRLLVRIEELDKRLANDQTRDYRQVPEGTRS